MTAGRSVTLGTYSTVASSLPTLTAAASTPGVSWSAVSILVTQEAQLMPSIRNRAVAVSDR